MTTNAAFPGDPFPLYRQTDNNKKELKKEKGLMGESNDYV